MSADDLVEVKFLRGIESLNPVKRITIAHVRSPSVQGVTRDEKFLSGKINEDVAIGVCVPKQENFDGFGGVVDDQLVVEDQTRKRHLNALEFSKVRLCLEQVDVKMFICTTSDVLWRILIRFS